MERKSHALLLSKHTAFSRNKRNILFLRQKIEDVLIDDLTKVLTRIGNVLK